jgi:hypothetical protein
MWVKGESGNPGGRSKGLRNKITKIKEAITNAFKPKDFEKWTKDNPTDFYNLMVKIMPKELDISDVTDYREKLKEELALRLALNKANVSTKK